MNHRLIVCTTSATQLAVVDVPTKPSDYWTDHCYVTAGKWLFDHPDHKMLSGHISNGDLTIWVAPIS